MSLLDKETVKRAEKALKDFDPKLNVVVLQETARTAIDASNSLKCEVGAIVKSLLFKAESNFILCLVAGDKRCSINKLKKITKIKDISMASPDEVKKQTGYTIGGVSPVGHNNKVEILIDNSLERFIDLFAAAGHPNCIFKINFKNLQKITNGKVKEIIE
ncbi:YbaK/EbsC family protein [Candidatus Pelagibacter sp.]|nr:YbaK/EbsC family protein [Candidatus Pelagibacter sp.]MDB9923496.1 YbaK/EbsC family protein [Candidatus Pelagibacter sp.]|tara:strand:+ start:599 stop:1078 length:480 start_codon:yes stop_codon:yes gene_type:complete